jgi:hypothetical protein
MAMPPLGPGPRSPAGPGRAGHLGGFSEVLTCPIGFGLVERRVGDHGRQMDAADGQFELLVRGGGALSGAFLGPWHGDERCQKNGALSSL